MCLLSKLVRTETYWCESDNQIIYNTYCQPVGTYGIGLLNVKKKTINHVNIMQNNLIRHMMDIPFKSHISNLLRVTKIIDIETLIDLNKCTVVKLLH